jgi:membrane protease YdiL (CAAX protease family)
MQVSKENKTKSLIYFPLLVVCLVAIFVFEKILPTDTFVEKSVKDLIKYALFIFITFLSLWYFNLKPFIKKKRLSLKSTLKILPCLLVCLLNPPIFGLILNPNTLNYQGIELVINVLLFFTTCLFTAVLEETIFRYVVFDFILESMHSSKKDVFLSIIISSLIFGLFHLLNAFSGFSFAVILQVIYSTLLGCMCAFALYITSNIIYSIILHTVFNFSGTLLIALGNPYNWVNLPMLIFIIVIAVTISIYVIYTLIKNYDLYKTQK